MKKVYVFSVVAIAIFATIILSACNPFVKPSETNTTSIEYVRLHSTTLLGTVVTVEGTVICAPGEIAPYLAYIQNGDYGILVDGNPSSTNFSSLKRRDKVEIKGVVDKPSAGYIQLGHYDGDYDEAAIVLKNLGTTTLPTPKVVTINELKTNSAIQGTLIELKDVSLEDPTEWPTEEGTEVSVILKDTIEATITMHIDKDTNIDGSATPTGSFDVIGVAAYYKGPQILPRNLDDIVTK